MLQMVSLEYMLLFPALLYFCIELYPSLSTLSLVGFALSVVVLSIRSFFFTHSAASVYQEAMAPKSTLYRAYVRGKIPWADHDTVT